MKELLDKFVNPEMIQSLSSTELFRGSIFVVIFGMGITFSVLILIMFAVMIMSKLISFSFSKKQASEVTSTNQKSGTPPNSTDNALVAAITAALVEYRQGNSNFIVRRIVPKEQLESLWHKLARINHMKE